MEFNEPMQYRRADMTGGSYFFTVNPADRQFDLLFDLLSLIFSYVSL